MEALPAQLAVYVTPLAVPGTGLAAGPGKVALITAVAPVKTAKAALIKMPEMVLVKAGKVALVKAGKVALVKAVKLALV
jgi:hypothetical protein